MSGFDIEGLPGHPLPEGFLPKALIEDNPHQFVYLGTPILPLSGRLHPRLMGVDLALAEAEAIPINSHTALEITKSTTSPSEMLSSERIQLLTALLVAHRLVPAEIRHTHEDPSYKESTLLPSGRNLREFTRAMPCVIPMARAGIIFTLERIANNKSLYGRPKEVWQFIQDLQNFDMMLSYFNPYPRNFRVGNDRKIRRVR